MLVRFEESSTCCCFLLNDNMWQFWYENRRWQDLSYVRKASIVSNPFDTPAAGPAVRTRVRCTVPARTLANPHSETPEH